MFKWMRISPLGRRLILALVILGGVITLSSSAIILWLDYQDGVKRYQNTLNQVAQSYESSVTNSLWTYDLDQLNALAQGITNFPGIHYVQVDNDREIIIQKGDPYAASDKKLTISLIFQDGEQLRHLGTLRLNQNYQELYHTLYNRAVDIIISQLILAFAIGLIALVVIHQLITRRLLKLIQWARNFNLSSLDIEPPVKKLGPYDELGLVVDAINQMRHTLKEDLRLREEEQTKHERLQSQLTLAVNNAELGFCRYSAKKDNFECNHHFANQLGFAVEDVNYLKKPLEYFLKQIDSKHANQQRTEILQLVSGKKVYLHDRYRLKNTVLTSVLDISFQVISYDNGLPDHILICSTNRTLEHQLKDNLKLLNKSYEQQILTVEEKCELKISRLKEEKNSLKRENRRLRIAQQPQHIEALSKLMLDELQLCHNLIPEQRFTVWKDFLTLNFYQKLIGLDICYEFEQRTQAAADQHNINYSSDLPLSMIAEEDPTILQFLFDLIINPELLASATAIFLKIRLIGNELSVQWVLTGNFDDLSNTHKFEVKLANIICNMRYKGTFTATKNANQLELLISAPFKTL